MNSGSRYRRKNHRSTEPEPTTSAISGAMSSVMVRIRHGLARVEARIDPVAARWKCALDGCVGAGAARRCELGRVRMNGTTSSWTKAPSGPSTGSSSGPGNELLELDPARGAHGLDQPVDDEDVVEVEWQLEGLHDHHVARHAAIPPPRLDREVIGVAAAGRRQVVRAKPPPGLREDDPADTDARQERRRGQRPPERTAVGVPVCSRHRKR